MAPASTEVALAEMAAILEKAKKLLDARNENHSPAALADLNKMLHFVVAVRSKSCFSFGCDRMMLFWLGLGFGAVGQRYLAKLWRVDLLTGVFFTAGRRSLLCWTK